MRRVEESRGSPTATRLGRKKRPDGRAAVKAEPPEPLNSSGATGSAPKMKRLLVVSNRLPCTLTQDGEGKWSAHPSAGGLVTGLEPILREIGGLWIGWSGATVPTREVKNALTRATRDHGYKVVAVELSAEEVEQFYYGYSNEVIWPLFHDLQELCNFDPVYWSSYTKVNGRFAEALRANSRRGDFIWIHDYQLIYVAAMLRKKRFHSPLAFFLHIPFPSLDILTKLPEHSELLQGLLHYDLVGLQTARDLRNFIQCVRRIEGATVVPHGEGHLIHWKGRQIVAEAFPIGIDARQFSETAALEDVARRAWNIHAGFPDRQLILGVDRLDYTKGIPDRLKAFRAALERHPDLHQRITFIQIVVPSRTHIPKYHALKTEIDRLVGEINGEFSSGNWVPIHYLFRSLEYLELLAYYRTAEIALITPLKDGMNLVAKEYCACSIEENSVLILSRFAGSAEQLKKGALLINPYDVTHTADTIYQAFQMQPRHRQARMRRMRANVKNEDIFAWVEAFFAALPPLSSPPEATDDPTRPLPPPRARRKACHNIRAGAP